MDYDLLNLEFWVETWIPEDQVILIANRKDLNRAPVARKPDQAPSQPRAYNRIEDVIRINMRRFVWTSWICTAQWNHMSWTQQGKWIGPVVDILSWEVRGRLCMSVEWGGSSGDELTTVRLRSCKEKQSLLNAMRFEPVRAQIMSCAGYNLWYLSFVCLNIGGDDVCITRKGLWSSPSFPVPLVIAWYSSCQWFCGWQGSPIEHLLRSRNEDDCDRLWKSSEMAWIRCSGCLWQYVLKRNACQVRLEIRHNKPEWVNKRQSQ